MRPPTSFSRMLMALGLLLSSSAMSQTPASDAVEVATPASTAAPVLLAGGGQVTPNVKYCPPEDDWCDPTPTGRSPSISWTQVPATGKYFLPTDTVVFGVSASDPDGRVVRVDFVLDGQVKATDTTAPYQMTLHGTTVRPHLVKAIAYDNQNQANATPVWSFTTRNSVVKGYIDGVSSDGILTGWACSSYLRQSIRVHLYLGGPYGTGTYGGSFLANQASGAGVDSACGVSSGSYRYHIALTDAQRIQYGGRSIYLYGISPVGGTNNLLTHAGSFTVPVFTRNAQYVSQSVGTSMVSGHTQTVSIKMRNNGDYTWTAGSSFRLGSQSTDNAAWGVSRAYLSSNVAPGQTATFTFTITAPSTAGSYSFRWRMLQEGVAWFGATTPNVTITVRDSVVRGYVDSVSSEGLLSGWACSSYLPQSIRVHLYLGGLAGSGGTYIGSYLANQASEADIDSACDVGSGSYRYQIALTDAQRIQYGGKSINVYGISPVGANNALLGGSGSLNVPVFIRNAQYVSQSVDASMVTGQTQTVSVSMRNNGDYTWTAGTQFKLGSQNPVDNSTWGVSRVSLSSNVAPGQTAAFNFTITAPATPGSYNFRWRMQQEGVAWFGALTPNVAITVSAPPPVVSFSSSIEYDELGRVLARHDSSGAVVASYVYDAESHVTAVTDALNHVSTMEYDALGRLAKSTNALNGVTRYAYDVADHLIQVTDPRGLVTSYTYDGFGQLWAQTSPDTGTSRQAFNASGQLATSTRNDGSVVAYGYDTLGRLTQKSAGQEVQHFSYDNCTAGIGRLCAVSDAMSTESFSYDPAGHLLQQELVGPNGRNMTTSYAYDGKGRLASLTYPDGAATHYTYAAGKLSRLQLTAGGVTTDLIKNIGYDVTGQPSYWTYGNNTYRMQSFDANGRLSGLRTMAGGGSLQNYKYVYNAVNLMTQRVNLGVPAKSASYGYDALGRLSSEFTNEAGTRLDYSYDANGNRLSVNWVGVGLTEDIIAANSNQLQSDGANSYSYNANGNRESWHVGDSIAIYAYDGFGRMLGTSRDVAYGNWTATYPAGITSYAVNPLGQRVYKNGPSGEFWFDYSPGGQLLSDYITGLGATDYVYFGGQPIALVRGGTISYLHDDHLGRPELATNSGGAVVWSASNGSFGRNDEQGSLAQMNLGFPGQYYDAETGHWYNINRDYDQQTGRYLESDPIGLLGGVNTYAYVTNSPVIHIDPSGLWSFTFGGYYGAGFEVTFGNDSGNKFLTARIGFGAGVGASWDPNGGIPGEEPDDRCDGGVVISASGQIGFNYGMVGASAEEGVARNYNNERSVVYGGSGASLVSEVKGIGVGWSVGGQITEYLSR